MCLSRVDEIVTKYTEGYKIFWRKKDNKLYPLYSQDRVISYKKRERETAYKTYFKIKRWIRDTGNYFIRDGYKCGFHFFPEKEDAILYLMCKLPHFGNLVVFKVKVKECVASGTTLVNFSNSLKTGVAKEILLLEEVKV